MRAIALALGLVACGPGLFQNSAPRLIAVNGVEVGALTGLPEGDPDLRYTPGEDFPIVLDWRDPEGQDVQAWWPESPRGWDFDPDATEGVWRVPADAYERPNVYVVLQDDHPERPMSDSWSVPLWTDAVPEDTGP